MKNSLMLLVAVIMTVVPALAQGGDVCDLTIADHLAGGYTGNIPEEWLGFCFFSTKPEGVGLYLDLKASVPLIYGGNDFYDNISAQEAIGWGDPLTDTQDTWVSGNIGMTKVLSNTLALYAGVGISVNTTYFNHYDPMHILGTNGSYWVEGESDSAFNALGGLLVTLGEKWGVQGGGELNPGGVTVGVFYIL